MLLHRDTWLPLAASHQQRISPWADRFVDRRNRGQKHPVEDFLFTYYHFPPGKLKQWVPPLGTAIEVTEPDLENHPHLRSHPHILIENGTAQLNPSHLPEKIRRLAASVADLCRRVLDRPPRFRCFGLHEWAMVYRQTAEQIRHQGYELRLPPAHLAAFVDSQALCCTHYDAYRFFTPEATPLNAFQPTLETRPDHEQGACLHANMDLYKWSAKLWPWIGSDLVGQAFALAFEGRVLDMRASPYALAHLGYHPIAIETSEGRAEYETAQRTLAEKALPLRHSLAQAASALADFPNPKLEPRPPPNHPPCPQPHPVQPAILPNSR
jgi:hypothetical protein